MSVLEIRDLHVSVNLPDGEAQAHPVRGRPDRRGGPDPRHHGPQRLRQVHLGVLGRRPPEVRGDRGRGHAGRAGRAGDVGRRAGPGRAVPGHAVPGGGAGGERGELPAYRQDRDRRAGAEAAHLGRGAAGRDGAARRRPGVRPAQRQRGLLRRGEEAARDRAAGAAQAEDRHPGRDRLRAGHRRAEGGQRGDQPGTRDRADRHAADHALHPDPAVREAGLRARLRRRADRRGGRPGAGRTAGGGGVRALPGRRRTGAL